MVLGGGGALGGGGSTIIGGLVLSTAFNNTGLAAPASPTDETLLSVDGRRSEVDNLIERERRAGAAGIASGLNIGEIGLRRGFDWEEGGEVVGGGGTNWNCC